MIPAAQEVIQRIRTRSELKELWDDSKEPAKWYAALDDLASRLDDR